jgi:hypothetical protein
LYYLCKQHGLELERIGRSMVKGYSRFLLAVFGLPVMAYTWYTLLLREKNPVQRQENRRLCAWLLHPRTLIEDNLILRLRKRETNA